MNKLLISLGIVGLIVVAVFWYSHEKAPIVVLGTPQGAYKNATTTGEQYNVIGTRIGTSTTGTPFLYTNGTTSAEWRIGTRVDTATYYFQTTQASSTGAAVYYWITASNDADCNTASSTAGQASDIPIKSDITWYNVGSLIPNFTYSATLPATTTVHTWLPVGANYGQTVTVPNLNAECLRLQVSATGTVLYVGLVTKSHLGY